MPIHAAGTYRVGQTICLSDFFIPSYTPTVRALLDARTRPVPADIKVLAAAQPNAGDGWSSLYSVEIELKEIIQAVPEHNLVSLCDTDISGPDYEGLHTSVENVMKKLPEANVLHLACHGFQDWKDPLSSGFVLANTEKLSIEKLMRCRLPNAQMAILSACHTASNDTEQPDEGMNMSSALVFLGFSSILATKWYVTCFRSFPIWQMTACL